MEDVEEIGGMNTQLKTRILTDVVISVEVLEFGPTLSSKSYVVAMEVHSNKLVTRSVKSPKERKNMKSEFGSN
jgi:hypothetical protein